MWKLLDGRGSCGGRQKMSQVRGSCPGHRKAGREEVVPEPQAGRRGLLFEWPLEAGVMQGRAVVEEDVGGREKVVWWSEKFGRAVGKEDAGGRMKRAPEARGKMFDCRRSFLRSAGCLRSWRRSPEEDVGWSVGEGAQAEDVLESRWKLGSADGMLGEGRCLRQEVGGGQRKMAEGRRKSGGRTRCSEVAGSCLRKLRGRWKMLRPERMVSAAGSYRRVS
ncbi:hypothetical protein FNV43_RR20314 [Rhamnella rubrinervis]|uniref:Uncharacterized protein n=1 Tax=Rhamnella rubrinervis TaxID=2594499 RepID=A0A8K0DYH9_9ROSA|nr:hypothetical protein FNV43_RR20314 [Rhamnella rubrinervis]